MAIACWQALMDIRVFNGVHLLPISGKIIATSPRISKTGNSACRSVAAPAFSLSEPEGLVSCGVGGLGMVEDEGRAPLKGGVGVSPTGKGFRSSTGEGCRLLVFCYLCRSLLQNSQEAGIF